MNCSRKDIILNAGFALALVILVVIGSLYYVNVTAMTEFDRMEENSFAVSLELEELFSAMLDVENGELTFILTGDEKLLKQYRAAIVRIEECLAKLKSLTKNSPAGQNRVYRVEPLIREKLAEVAETIAAREKEGFRAAYQSEFNYEHEQVLEEVRSQLAEAREAIGRHLDREIAVKEARTGRTTLAFFTGSILSLSLLLSIFLLLRRDITRRQRAEEKIEKLNTLLAERAAQLETVNRELEAFNYTVAHDLRKPLTVVNSYCQVIRELCGGKLDEQCQGYLEEIYKGTMSMNRLIDALLNFSRLTHVELHREAVDLGAMATVVTSELRFAEPGRQVTFRITAGIRVEGDANLLRLVLDNLFGNSWKYTAVREEAVIEFGAMEIDNQQAFFIRDNGAGFDMADADKLFIPFKRLPGAEECRGFGVGLATVERIIRRHGGRVWAEGEPGNGATFYFTLPPAEARAAVPYASMAEE